jgi:3-oxocholest-4-en-26-oyl-CoA dehydrogenase alpha subunit
MYCQLTTEQYALRDELRAYFSRLITPPLKEALREHAATPTYKQVIRQIGKDGYLAVGWPVEYGGRGYGAIEQMIFVQEALRAGAPIPFVTLSTLGPTLMLHGSEMQKKTLLPGIASGELHFAIGYTEANSGTDLASLKTRASLEGERFKVNGSKVYTSHAEGADYIWLAARTDPDVPQHKGISILLVDTRTKGFSLTPIDTVAGMHTNVTYYDDVEVPLDMLVGELHGGWKLITSQLNYERIGIAARGVHGEELYRRTLLWARERRHGRRPIDEPLAQRLLASVYSRLETLRIFNYRLAWNLTSAQPDPAFACAAKVVGVETLVAICRDLLQVLGLGGLVVHGSEAALIAGDVEAQYRRCQLNTFGGGSGEVMREMVAVRGLNMPRTNR